ncbi:MAG: UDP-3-O-(3-hydroxymyristoyl)glucosamine N-acyltransferase, partial [Armatimonadetes bacterium]|nr:UDP-3-O-(3-hydroxymyristoyl)glucosamine N-acyltransferase [Armatimonadota bacterium]
MAAEQSSWTLGELAQILGAELVGPAEAVILRPVGAGTNDPSGITFAESDRYFPKIIGSGVGACLVPLGTGNLGVPLLRVRSPRAAFGMMLGLAARPLTLPPGVHPTAQIDPTAQVDKTAKIGAFCVVGAEATIGAGSEIHSGCFVGDRCVVGEHTTLKPGVTLVKDVMMGMACLIHSGAVLGAPGFGFAFDGKKHMHIPQVGGVLLGDFVEIGANTCVDRATVGNTEIGTGT